MPDAPPRPVRLPPHAPGMAIGLYGGSFNPPHAAHLLVARAALRRLALDRIWWLVTPGNPLKRNGGLPPLAERIAAARALAADPRIVVTGLEAALGTRYTIDTVAALQRRAPGVSFVWVMGADTFVELPRWKHWQGLMRRIPLAVVDRPGFSHAVALGRAGQTFAAARLREWEAGRLARTAPPAWVMLHGPRSSLSSTELRRRNAAPPAPVRTA